MEKDTRLNEAIISPILEHIEKEEPMLFLSIVKCDLMSERSNLRYGELKRIAKLTHFGTNKLIGEYIEDDEPAQMETHVLFGKKERAKELKDLAIGIGKKFRLAVAMFIYPDGKTVHIKTIENGDPVSIGTEIETSYAISLDIIEQFYSLREDGGFSVKSVGEAEAPLYGSWANAMICGSWEECYKKYGADALEVWESRIR